MALVATLIPMNPARAEQKAPTTKETAVNGEEDSFWKPLKASNTAMQATKMVSTLYSARRKAIAPSWIEAAMPCILSLPGSCLATQEDFQQV